MLCLVPVSSDQIALITVARIAYIGITMFLLVFFPSTKTLDSVDLWATSPKHESMH